MKPLAITLELLGMGILIAAIVEGVGQNPGTYLAILGGLLVTCGAFLWNKVRRRK